MWFVCGDKRMRQKKFAQIRDYSKGMITTKTPVELPPGASPSMLNFELWNNILRRTRGIQDFAANTFTGIPLKMEQFVLTGGGSYLVLVTVSKIYYWNTGTSQWTDITGTSGWTGTAVRNVSTDIMSNKLFICDGENDVMEWTGTGDVTVCSELATLVITSYFVSPFWSHLLLANTIESGTACPQRVRWSDTGDEEEWDSGNANFVDLVDTVDFITGMAALMDKKYIYKERSIYELVYVGYPRIFIPAPLIDGVGCIAPGTLENMGTHHIFLGSDNIYTFDGRKEEIVGDDIRNLIFGTNSIVNPGAIQNSIGMYIEEIEEYWLGVPTGVSTVPNHFFRYHYPTESWRPRTYSNTIYCFGVWYEDSAKKWTDLVGKWTDQSWKWNDTTMLAAYPVTLFGCYYSSAGHIKKLDFTTPLDGDTLPETWWETGDIEGTQRWVEYWVECEGFGSLELLYSTDEGVSWTSLGVKSVPSQYSWIKWSFNLTRDLIRFKLVHTETGDINIRKQIPWYVPKVRPTEVVTS